MKLGLAGHPALAALKLGASLDGDAKCEELRTLNDLMLASDSHGWLLEVVGQDILKKRIQCLEPPVLLAWAREKLRALDPSELPSPDQMLRTESESVEFVHDDDEAVMFEFDTPVLTRQEGPKSSAVTFDATMEAPEDIEFEFGETQDPAERERLSSGEIAFHFQSTLSREFSGRAESQRLYLWATFDYLRGETEQSEAWFLKLAEHSQVHALEDDRRRAEVGLARLAFDSQRFSESFERFEGVSVLGDSIETRWLPELVWSAYFAGRDDFLNRLFEWISADKIHPIALGDALGLVPRILEEQCRRADALKVTSYLIEAMRQASESRSGNPWGPYASLMEELDAFQPDWLLHPPFALTSGWLTERAKRHRKAFLERDASRVRQALSQLLRTRIDMRLGRGLVRCRL